MSCAADESKASGSWIKCAPQKSPDTCASKQSQSRRRCRTDSGGSCHSEYECPPPLHPPPTTPPTPPFLWQVPIEEQLAKGLTFIQEHREKLGDIEGAINESISEVWETQADAVSLHLQPVEKVEVLDLVNPHRNIFKKIITVLAVLCDEITFLKAKAENIFFPDLLMYGQDGEACGEEEDEDEDEEIGKAEARMGKRMIMFQEISNFVDRCNSIAINMVHQVRDREKERERREREKREQREEVFTRARALLLVCVCVCVCGVRSFS